MGLLDELYGDPDVLAVPARHDVPLRPEAGSIAERFPEPVAVGPALLEDLYVTTGLSARHVELLTGQPAGQLLDAHARGGHRRQAARFVLSVATPEGGGSTRTMTIEDGLRPWLTYTPYGEFRSVRGSRRRSRPAGRGGPAVQVAPSNAQ